MTDELQIVNEIETAVELCEKEYSHEEIIAVLKTENDLEKQICLMKLSKLSSQEEADLLLFQLTGHHGLIREAAANKINDFVTNNKHKKLFVNDFALSSFLKAVNDINPNICRLICPILPLIFENHEKEKSHFIKNLYERFFVIFEELEKLKRSNFYTKKLFHLYWSLETLAFLEPDISEDLERILETSAAIRDYTIREKTAMVLSLMNTSSQKIDKIKAKLKNDDNFYVKRYAKSF